MHIKENSKDIQVVIKFMKLNSTLKFIPLSSIKLEKIKKIVLGREELKKKVAVVVLPYMRLRID